MRKLYTMSHSISLLPHLEPVPGITEWPAACPFAPARDLWAGQEQETTGETAWVIPHGLFTAISPYGIHGTIAYLPTFGWLIFMVN